MSCGSRVQGLIHHKQVNKRANGQKSSPQSPRALFIGRRGRSLFIFIPLVGLNITRRSSGVMWGRQYQRRPRVREARAAAEDAAISG